MRIKSTAKKVNVITPSINKDLTPRVLKVTNLSNDRILDLEIPVIVDIELAKKNDVSIIEVLLSSKSISSLLSYKHEKKDLSNAFKRPDTSGFNNPNLPGPETSGKFKKVKTLQQNIQNDDNLIESGQVSNPQTIALESTSNSNRGVSRTIKGIHDTPLLNLRETNEMFAGTKKLAVISLDQYIKQSLSKNSRKKVEAIKKVNPGKNYFISNRLKGNIRSVFSKRYHSLFKKEIDPICVFENPYGKNAATYTLDKEIQLLIRDYFSQIQDISKNEYEFKVVTDNSNTIKAKSNTSINLSNIKSFESEQLYLIFIAKNRFNKRVQTSEYVFTLEDLLDQIQDNSIEFNLSSSRTPTGVSKVSVINRSAKENIDIDLIAKSYSANSFDSKIITVFEPVEENLVVAPKNQIKIVDGVVNSRSTVPENFKASNVVFYRGLLNFRKDKYFNCKSSSSPSVKKGNVYNVPNLNLFAKINTEKKCVDVFVNNISSNITSIKLKKYKLSGSSKRNPLPTKDKEFKTNLAINVKNQKTVTVSDYDVQDGKNYIYYFECVMNNSVKKDSTKNFLVSYIDKQNKVNISDVSIKQSPALLEGELRDLKKATSPVTIKFKIEKSETEVEKILQNIYGNLFDVMKERIQTIKNAQGYVYSVKIDRINNETGEAETITTLSPDVNNYIEYTDMTCPALDSSTYVIDTRIEIASQLIDEIEKLIEEGYPGYQFASYQKSLEKNSKKIKSRQKFKDPRARKSKSFIARKDMFDSKSTGDIHYIDVTRESDYFLEKTLRATNSKIVEVYLGKTENLSSKFNHKNDRYKRYFNVEFDVTNDFFVDFYGVFIKDESRVYLDGAMHSKDSLSDGTKRYNYLLETNKKNGLLEVYLAPIYKDGTAGYPFLIQAKIINSEY